MPSNLRVRKSKLNNSRLQTFGSYKALYDVEPVDESKHIFRGRPVPEPAFSKIPGAQKAFDVGWIYFTKEYDDRNDWDRLYHVIELSDESIIGVHLTLVPKEKLLFGYEPPTSIALPPAGINFRR